MPYCFARLRRKSPYAVHDTLERHRRDRNRFRARCKQSAFASARACAPEANVVIVQNMTPIGSAEEYDALSVRLPEPTSLFGRK
ncbi:MAG: hypothetical protein ACLTMP_08885 [Eggerthella lenta]